MVDTCKNKVISIFSRLFKSSKSLNPSKIPGVLILSWYRVVLKTIFQLDCVASESTGFFRISGMSCNFRCSRTLHGNILTQYRMSFHDWPSPPQSHLTNTYCNHTVTGTAHMLEATGLEEASHQVGHFLCFWSLISKLLQTSKSLKVKLKHVKELLYIQGYYLARFLNFGWDFFHATSHFLHSKVCRQSRVPSTPDLPHWKVSAHPLEPVTAQTDF